jgi:hypothetical protein
MQKIWFSDEIPMLKAAIKNSGNKTFRVVQFKRGFRMLAKIYFAYFYPGFQICIRRSSGGLKWRIWY